jgi:hypothetical protein
MKRFIIISLLAGLISACRKDSSEIDQNRIYQEYSVVYNNQTGNTEVSASFREDNASGKKLRLTGGAKVYFNEQQISGKSNFSQTYSGFISPVKIEFVDGDGKKYTNYSFGINYIDVNPLENFISGTNNYFSWGGSAVGQNESVTFYARNTDGRSNDQTVSQQGASAINLNSTFFNNFQNQFFTYWLKRKSISYLGDYAVVGGSFSVYYRSQDYEEELFN